MNALFFGGVESSDSCFVVLILVVVGDCGRLILTAYNLTTVSFRYLVSIKH